MNATLVVFYVNPQYLLNIFWVRPISDTVVFERLSKLLVTVMCLCTFEEGWQHVGKAAGGWTLENSNIEVNSSLAHSKFKQHYALPSLPVFFNWILGNQTMALYVLSFLGPEPEDQPVLHPDQQHCLPPCRQPLLHPAPRHARPGWQQGLCLWVCHQPHLNTREQRQWHYWYDSNVNVHRAVYR